MRFRRWMPWPALIALGAAVGVAAAQPSKGGAETEAGKAEGPEEKQASPLSDLPIVREQLDNGLQVVMSPDRTVPTVAVAVYYDVGSRNEEKGRSGFAHLFEHMMFQGSANVGKMQHFELIVNRGGSANGTTSADRTNYFETLPAHELALGLWLEADRMKSLAVTADNFENQRQTVKEERRQRVDNQPYVPSMIRINELAYESYWPYGHPTIGYMQDLDEAPLSAVQDFFDTYYAPNNAVLALVGDFEPDEAMRQVKKYFGDIPRSDVPEYDPPPIEPQSKERTDRMKDALAELPAFHIAYHIPPSRTPDHYPLEVMAAVLGEGKSSRLYQTLVKKKEMVQEIDVSTDDRRGPDLFSFWSILAGDHPGEEVRQVIYDEIERIAEKGVTERELQKAKNRIRASLVFDLQSNLARAMNLAQFELYWGDARLLREELDRYLEVTNEDIRRVAQKYFEPGNRTVLDVVPAKQQGAKQ